MGKPRFTLSVGPRPQKQIESQHAYYIALGRFINDFAEVEAQLLLTLCRCAKTDRATAKALFSGVRIEQASDFLRRLGAAKKIGTREFTELNDALLPQIKAITQLRNDIVHYGVRFRADRLTVDNQRGVGRTQVRRYAVSARLLDNARSDLGRILLRLWHLANKGTPEGFTPSIRKALYGAWRYKSRAKPQKHPQSDRKNADRAKAKVPPRQPEPSRR